MDRIIESSRPETAFREKPRENPALVGAAAAVGAFMLGLALLPPASENVARFDGPEAIEMLGSIPATAERVYSASSTEFRLVPATGMFEEGLLEVQYDVWG